MAFSAGQTGAASDQHRQFLAEALAEAKAGIGEGGLPIGAVLVRGTEIVGRGHNRRIQDGNPIAHGEMSCLIDAGRQRTFKDTVLYTTLSPCMMCTGTIIQFGIPFVVVGDSKNYRGFRDVLELSKVQVLDLGDPGCMSMMEEWMSAEDNKIKWNEDIGIPVSELK